MYCIIFLTEVGFQDFYFSYLDDVISISTYFSLYIFRDVGDTGSFIFLASIYYLYYFYQKQDSYKDKFLLLKLSLSVFALLNTKFPYGYLFILALFLVHTSLYFEEVILFGTRYIAYITNEFKKQYRIMAIMLLILIYLLFPASILKGKAKHS